MSSSTVTHDGAERAAHPVTDLAALERRAGGRRARPEAVARAEQHPPLVPMSTAMRISALS
jgi:hypothetical protein